MQYLDQHNIRRLFEVPKSRGSLRSHEMQRNSKVAKDAPLSPTRRGIHSPHLFFVPTFPHSI
jgi:hypothetical protein